MVGVLVLKFLKKMPLCWLERLIRSIKMNINNSNVYLKKELLNLNTANKIKDEVIETPVEISNLPTNEPEPQEQLLIPNSQQILMNNGVKINYLSKTDSVEIANNVTEKDKVVDIVSQLDESTEPVIDDNSPKAQTCASGMGWKILKGIIITAANIVGWILNPIGKAISTVISIASDLIALRK